MHNLFCSFKVLSKLGWVGVAFGSVFSLTPAGRSKEKDAKN